jgi:molybdopterin/thiamine biosynthesis adenylyltransferase
MRSSTVLILSLRSVAHEIIKNLVLAGIGRLIVMDDSLVTEEDLGSGFLFREEDGAVGQEVSYSLLNQSELMRLENNSSSRSDPIPKPTCFSDGFTDIIAFC